jgi:serine/tyrosine/threonine adenylyltransferase
MAAHSLFNFDYSYLTLPVKFYSLVRTAPFPQPEIFLLNKELANQLDVDVAGKEDLCKVFLEDSPSPECKTFAQAYAGHQFGHFTMLGDGRAIVLGEHLTENNERFDIQLKGSGRTPYSRGGDGKATLKAMLREYLVSEAMYHLHIPTSRSLAVITTGEPVYRNEINQGATLVRVMKSHIRVGTFEYAAYYGSTDDLKVLTEYTVRRLYPAMAAEGNLALQLLRKVMENQIDLAANWMRVGFIHGVMNTDNTSISGETFDYGPCAFMNSYHPDTVYSSIDHNGRYAFGNQPKIIKWNIARFAEALLPIISEDKSTSLACAQMIIDEFDAAWENKYYSVMLNKIGLETKSREHYALLDELLDRMKSLNLDYTNTFWELSRVSIPENSPLRTEVFSPWLAKWKHAIDTTTSSNRALNLMGTVNPVVIPRNHLVEQALEEAINGHMTLYERLLQVVSNPYQFQNGLDDFTKPSLSSFERTYQTFCGT